ncbi:endolysin [Mycobacterium phage Aminay]|uniref:Lysin B n=1 Tax=Mycobacterium phage Aminay TaxID=2250291 RepID=A0A345KV17_9CAUD|nr:endolysin [Mycobacterium phage Aminay]AXH46869.1 lysin B [Mycobacterium phage Aminay]
MILGGKWVGLGLGDASPEIRKIKAYMRAMFRSYAGQLADTELYDQQMTDAVFEMQRRYRDAGKLAPELVNGIIGATTKYVMGYLKPPAPVDARPVLFTVCGTGVPWWVGPDADTARAVEDRYLWQPIGYRAAAVPMGPSITEGRAELRNQFNIHRGRVERYGAVLAGYSQGAVITSEFWEYDVKPENGSHHWAMPFIRKAVAWGNPMREKGKAYPDPGAQMAGSNTSGVATPLMVDTPSWWRNYAHVGDLYTTANDDESRENKTAIWQIIRGTQVFSGPDSLLAQFLEITKAPIPGAIGAFKAMFDAMAFFGKQTGPHVNYNVQPAIDYLRSGAV